MGEVGTAEWEKLVLHKLNQLALLDLGISIMKDFNFLLSIVTE